MEKTEYMNINHANTDNLKSSTGIQIKRVNDFKYLGSYVSSTEKYVKIRLAKSCAPIMILFFFFDKYVHYKCCI